MTKDILDELLSSCLDEDTIVILELELLKESLGIREDSGAEQTISRMEQRIRREADRLREIKSIIKSGEIEEREVAAEMN